MNVESLTRNGYFRWIAAALLVLFSGGLLAIAVQVAMLDALKQDTVDAAAISARVANMQTLMPSMNERLTRMDVRIERIEQKAEDILERVVRMESRSVGSR